MGTEQFLHLSKGFSLRDRVRPISNERIYHDYMEDVLRAILNNRDVEKISPTIHEVDRSVDVAFSKPAHPEPARISVLGLFHPQLSLRVWLRAINRHVKETLMKQDDHSEILVTGLGQLQAVMSKLNENTIDSEHVSVYLLMHIAMETLRYDYFRRYEVQHPRDVVVRCLNTTRRFLRYTWPYLIANLTSNEATLEASNEIFHEIRHESVGALANSSWMELPSQLEASEKLKRMKLVSINGVHPPVMSQRVTYVHKLTLKDEFVEAYLDLAAFSTNLSNNVYGHEMQAVYGDYQMVGKVAYLVDTNVVIIPTVATLPPMFYSRGVQRSFNYGMLGVAVAYAVNAAVGPTGSEKMADGINVNWWTDSTIGGFRNTINCYASQYRRLYNTTRTVTPEEREDLFLWMKAVRIAFDR